MPFNAIADNRELSRRRAFDGVIGGLYREQRQAVDQDSRITAISHAHNSACNS
jgi:hypothetical protein